MTYFRVIHTIMGPKCLTAVFGMGTGVATWVWSPARRMGRLPFSARVVRGMNGFIARNRRALNVNDRNIKKAAAELSLYAILVSLHGGIPMCRQNDVPARRGSMRSSDWLLVPVS